MDLFMMNCELLTTCSALGYLEEDKYFKEPDCIDTVKCIIKYLHNEDNTCTIRVQLGAAQILQNDLLPIMSQFPAETDLFQAVLRLVVNLTQPSLLCFGGKIPKDTAMHHHFLDVMSYNQAYKEAFGEHSATWKVLGQKMFDVLETEWEDRKPEDTLLVERILVLIRNLLHTPPTSDDAKKTAADMSLHDKLLWQLHQSEIDTVIQYMAGSSSEQEWSLHVIEIVCLILKEQKADQLAETASSRSAAEREKEGNELLEMRKIEEAKKQQQRSTMSARHSRFGGTYVVQGTKALSDSNDLIVHRSLAKCSKISFDDGKAKLRKAKNRRRVVEDSIARHSSYSIRSILKEFCRGLLDGGYNVLMRAVKDRISREKAQDSDETYYFWAMSFFLEFNRLSHFQIGFVSETIQLATLHFVETQMINYYELMLNDKHEAQSWSRKIHLALRCYHEFLKTIQIMELSNDPALKESAKVLLNNIFYVVEYREIFLTLLRKFDERKQSHGFLKDLVRSTHLFVKMFESYCKESSVVVQKKVRGKSKKSRKKKVNRPNPTPVLSDEEKAQRWESMATIIEENLQNNVLVDGLQGNNVFDPTLDLTEEAQQRQAVVKIQKLLINSNVSEAVKLLRTAREIWPEQNLFGAADIGPQQETNVLQEVFFARFSEAELSNPPPVDGDHGDEEMSDDDEEELPQRIKEIEFNFKEYLRKFAEGKIISPYVTLLKSFEENGTQINHCIIKMLHRVGFDLSMYGLLFQASLFRIFQKAFTAVKFNKNFKELTSFGKWIMGKFFEVSLNNNHLFVEALFWKGSAAEVYEVVEGYGSFPVSGKSGLGLVWSNEEKNELEELYNQYKDGGSDVVDGILAHITDDTRTRRQICQQLVRQGLVNDIASLKKSKGSKLVIWREDDVEELKRLVEEYKSSADPLGNIMQMMNNKKSKKKVIEKILSLGLVSDRKELLKKRSKQRKTNSNPGTSSEILHIGGNTSDREDHSDDSNNGFLSSPSSSDDDEPSERDEKCRFFLERCNEAGFEEEILWIRRSLEAVADERRQSADSDTHPAVPIVPFTETQEEAFSNRNFKKLLRSLQLHPPSNEQEVFWRIPSALSSEDLEYCMRLLICDKRKRSEHDSDNDSINFEKPKKKKAVIIDDE